MSFFPPARERLVPGVGRDTAKIVIVGDYTSNFDDKALRPFSGPAGSVIESCLHGAGLIKGEVYLTNIFKSKTTARTYKESNLDFFDEHKKKFTEKGLRHAHMLREELNAMQPNVIVAAGLPALMALTPLSSISKFRGYVTTADKLSRPVKLIPTFSPNSAIRTYINRHVIVCDLRKAKEESGFPEVVRPERKLIWDYANVEEVLQWLAYLEEQKVVCFDIEVINYETACISFAATPDVAFVIPFGATESRPNGWSEWDELQIWRGVQRVLGNPNSLKIVQNGIFDIHFLLTRNNIEVRGPVHDTMIGHSVMFPELPKGLEFLGSVYCGSQEHWKDMVKFDNIKGES